MTLTRRTILAGAAGVLAAPSVARAQATDVTFRLNWLLYGFHTPFHLGIQRGFYREAGINLTIGEGQGSARTVQAVAAGSETFGLSDGASIMAGVARGAPLQAVMGIMCKSPFAVIFHAAANVRGPRDMEGKTIAAAPGEAGLTIFPAIVRANNLNADRISFVRVDATAKMVAFLERRVDGFLGGIENQAILVQRRGLQTTTIAYSDVGANTMGLAIHARRDTLERNPDLVRRFVAATRRALEAGEREPEAAVAAGIQVKPDLDRDLSLDQLRAGLALVRSAHGQNQPVGWQAAQDWESTLDIMKTYQGLETNLPASAFFTNDFLPRASG